MVYHLFIGREIELAEFGFLDRPEPSDGGERVIST